MRDSGLSCLCAEPDMVEFRRPKPVVLVVEDEALILLNTLIEIEDAGFEAISAANADAAIAILNRRNDVRLIFTDVMMPGSMDGLKLAAAVRDRWPPIKIIVTSAFRDEKHKLPAGVRFFVKPYRAPDVITAIKELVGAP